MVVHLGLVVVALAFTVSSAYASNGQFTMSEGDTVELAGHTLTYEGVVQRDLPQGLEYTMAVRIDDQVYEPKVTRFASSGQVIGTPSVKTGLRRDIYLAVSAPPTESEPRITLRVIIQPGVSFLWIGGMVMVIGTAMAAVPEAGRARRRGISTVDDGPAGRAPIEEGSERRSGGRRRRTDRRGRRRAPGPVSTTVRPGSPDAAVEGSEPPRTNVRRVALAVAGVMVLLFGVLIVATTRSDDPKESASSPLVGAEAPPLVADTLDGDTVDLRDYRGSWVLVNFFATWCVPCQVEHPELVRFSEQHAGPGDAHVISVAFQDEPADLKAFFAENGGDWPVAVGDTSSIALDYGVVKLPESYVVAPSGVIVAKVAGGVKADDIDRLIAAASGASAQVGNDG
jgi:cytochrome c biogenesis protein CcmG/thiol:disulfide interchange protein DsbE